MQTYVLRRLLLFVPTVLGATILIFVVIRILPGDLLSVMFGEEGSLKISLDDRARLTAQLGLDKPIYLQYLKWVGDGVRGDLGKSYWGSVPISSYLQRRAFISGELAVIAVVISWVFGLPLGILSAVRQNTALDQVLRVVSILGLAIPGFWLALIVVKVGYAFSWSPPAGSIIFPWDDPWGNFQQVVPGACVVGFGAAAIVARMSRSSFLEVIREDYIRTARAKGLGEHLIVMRHALKNAIIPVLTISSVQMGHLFGGAVTVETALNIPGLGVTLTAAMASRDFPVIQNLVLFYVLVFIVVNLVVDLLYGWLDPRIRYR